MYGWRGVADRNKYRHMFSKRNMIYSDNHHFSNKKNCFCLKMELKLLSLFNSQYVDSRFLRIDFKNSFSTSPLKEKNSMFFSPNKAFISY